MGTWNTIEEGVKNGVGAGTSIASGGFVGDPSQAWNDISGKSAQDAAKSGYNGAYSSGQAAYDAMMKQNKSLDQSGMTYTSDIKGVYGKAMNDLNAPFAQYDQQLGSAIKSAEGQASDGRKVYNGSIEPMQRSNMEVAARNAASSMTLADAMNPNNAMAQQIRQQYDNQAAGEMRQAGASSGVLQALGGQQLAMQMQAGPMTGSQQQAAYADATGAAGQRMAQGVANAGDIRNQGDQTALDQTNLMYQAGLDSRTNAAKTANDYMQGGRSFRGDQASSRDQLRGLYGEQANAKTGKQKTVSDMMTQMNQADLEQAKRKTERDAAAVNAKYGTQIASRGSEAQNRAASAGQMGGSLIGIGGKVAGAFL